MRIPLEELAPEWLSSGAHAHAGVAFLCLCGRHRTELWFLMEGCPTASPVRPLYESSGKTFDKLTVRDGFDCGHDWLWIKRGHVCQA